MISPHYKVRVDTITDAVLGCVGLSLLIVGNVCFDWTTMTPLTFTEHIHLQRPVHMQVRFQRISNQAYCSQAYLPNQKNGVDRLTAQLCAY